MNANAYDEWSNYYDTKEKKEFKMINKCMADDISMNIWKDKRVLEIGCGSGRMTDQYIDYVSYAVVIDPDENRINILKNKIKDTQIKNPCAVLTGELTMLINSDKYSQYFEQEFDIIFFPWSWAYISNQKETFEVANRLLKSGGTLLAHMVEDGEFENFVIDYNINYSKDPKDIIPNDLIRNKTSMRFLRTLLVDRNYSLNEEIIDTGFIFKDVNKAVELIIPLLINPDQVLLSLELEKYANDKGEIAMSDIVLCICGIKK